jgi:ATP-dependent Clp protease ATP-binding subunit ClpC
MYTKFTKRVEEVVKIANTIAREYELDYVGTEHILLALAREGTGLAAKLLAQRGLDEARLKAEVDRLTQKSMEDTWVFGRLPGTPHFRNVVAVALEEAERKQAGLLRTEHLLLALLREQGSVAYNALTNLGCTYDEIDAAIIAAGPQND